MHAVKTYPQAEIWYLSHSGFAVRTATKLLIFDYAPQGAPLLGELDQGLLQPALWEGRQVFLFASHRHGDHFDPRVLEWRGQIPDIRFVLSDDIRLRGEKEARDILWVHFGKEYQWQGLSIRTLHSTDEGVAFVVWTDGLCLYHAGDLNWWHWNEESRHYNDSMAGQYRKEIDSLAGMPIDLAFVPLDPRLEENYLLGMDYFLRKTHPRMVFPMHFWGDYAVFDTLQNDPRAEAWRDLVTVPRRRGQHFFFNPESRSNNRPDR